jgi:hypothetical protein
MELMRALYLKSAASENCQIQELRQYDAVADKILRPLIPPC